MSIGPVVTIAVGPATVPTVPLRGGDELRARPESGEPHAV